MLTSIQKYLMTPLYLTVVNTGHGIVGFILPPHRPTAIQLRDDARQEEARLALDTSLDDFKVVAAAVVAKARKTRRAKPKGDQS